MALFLSIWTDFKTSTRVYRSRLVAAKEYCLSCHVECMRSNLIIRGGRVGGRVVSGGGIAWRGLVARTALQLSIKDLSVHVLSAENASYRTIFGSMPGDSWYSVSSEARMAAAMMHCLTDGCVAVCGIGFVIWNGQSSTRLRNTVCVYVDNTP